MDEKQVFVVDGFQFENKADAEKAMQELEGVKYIKKRTKKDDLEMLLQMYNKMVDEKLFETMIGISFLRELQINLIRSKTIQAADIKPVYMLSDIVAGERNIDPSSFNLGKKRDTIFSAQRAPRVLKTSLFVNLSLVLIIISIFVVSIISNRTTILNYRTKVTDEYAAWEEELSGREEQIRQKERE